MSADPITTVYGRIVPGHVVDRAVTATIQERIEDYLAAISVQWDRPLLVPFRSYNIRPTGERWVEDQLPACIVVNAGLESAPVRSGDGQYDAAFRVGVVAICSGRSAEESVANAQDYTAAVRAMLLQHGSLGGLASSLELAAESYTEGESDGQRTQAGAVVEFSIVVPYIVNRRKHPPLASVPTDVTGVVETTFLDVDQLPKED